MSSRLGDDRTAHVTYENYRGPDRARRDEQLPQRQEAVTLETQEPNDARYRCCLTMEPAETQLLNDDFRHQDTPQAPNVDKILLLAQRNRPEQPASRSAYKRSFQ